MTVQNSNCFRDTNHLDVSAPRNDTYHVLKQRVSSIKQEQQKLLRNQRTIEEMEGAVLLEQRHQYETALQQLQDKLTKAQEQLKVNLDRSAKLRSHYDREKKALTTEVEQLRKTLETIDAEHAAQVDTLQKQYEQRVQTLEEQLTQVRQETAAALTAKDTAHAAALENVDQWCQGEVEAVRHMAQQEQDMLKQDISKWQTEFQDQCARRAAAQDAARLAESELLQAQGEIERLSSQLGDCQVRCQGLEAAACEAASQHERELQDQQAQLTTAHNEQVQAQKSKHARHLELINTRLQEVISWKDATIAGLQSELLEVNKRLESFQEL